MNQLAYLDLLKTVTLGDIANTATVAWNDGMEEMEAEERTADWIESYALDRARGAIEDWLIENGYRPPNTDAATWSILAQQRDRLLNEWKFRPGLKLGESQ